MSEWLKRLIESEKEHWSKAWRRRFAVLSSLRALCGLTVFVLFGHTVGLWPVEQVGFRVFQSSIIVGWGLTFIWWLPDWYSGTRSNHAVWGWPDE